MDFVIDAKSRKNMLIDNVAVNATNMKKKNGPGSRRRLAMTRGLSEVSGISRPMCRVLLTVQRSIDKDRVCDLVRQVHDHGRYCLGAWVIECIATVLEHTSAVMIKTYKSDFTFSTMVRLA